MINAETKPFEKPFDFILLSTQLPRPLILSSILRISPKSAPSARLMSRIIPPLSVIFPPSPTESIFVSTPFIPMMSTAMPSAFMTLSIISLFMLFFSKRPMVPPITTAITLTIVPNIISFLFFEHIRALLHGAQNRLFMAPV